MLAVLVDGRLDQAGFIGRLGAGGRAPAGRGISPPSPACRPSGRRAHRPHNWDSPAAWPFRARITASRAMMARVSLASPFSARVQLLLNSFSRTARSASEVSSGCWVVFCSGMTYLPFSPRALAASTVLAISASDRPGKLGLVVQHQRAGLGGGHQLLLELGFQAGIFLVDRLQLRLVLVGQQRAGMDELAVIKRQHLQRLGIQLQAGALVVKRLHPREEFGIEKDGVVVRRQLGRFHASAPCPGRDWCWPAPRRRRCC